jgi:DNA-binding IclR family transcriptional regulator
MKGHDRMDDKTHKILGKAMMMLEYVSYNPDGVSLTEICKHVGIAKGSAHILLYTFVQMKYMRRDPKTGLYTLGIRTFEVGSRFVERNAFYTNAREILEGLVAVTGETAHLAVLDGIDVVYINKFDSSQPVRMVSFIGKRIPAHATAIGKALLSGYSDEKIREIYEEKSLEKVTPNTIDDLEKLIEQIHEIRFTGLAYEKEESTPGVQCISIAIHNRSGSVVAAISISIPVSRGAQGVEKFIGPLLEAKSSLQMTL